MARARAALETAGGETVSADAEGCCGQPVASAATQAPESVDADTATCCGPGVPGISSDSEDVSALGEIASELYGEGELSQVPEAAQLAAAGCGNPVAIAELEPGETVLDLGSGGGIDCFLAGKQVGEAGEVWGLDMTPDMVQLARRNAEQVSATNVHFRLGEIEDIPFEDAKFDAVISNCVINLSPDKPQVFREAFRIVKPGGRLRVSDIVLTQNLDEDRRQELEDWAGCVGGALPLDEYLDAVRDAGFQDVTADIKGDEDGIASAYVSGRRPE